MLTSIGGEELEEPNDMEPVVSKRPAYVVQDSHTPATKTSTVFVDDELDSPLLLPDNEVISEFAPHDDGFFTTVRMLLLGTFTYNFR